MIDIWTYGPSRASPWHQLLTLTPLQCKLLVSLYGSAAQTMYHHDPRVPELRSRHS